MYKFFMMVFLVAVCILPAISSAQDDNYEPNNSFSTAYQISTGDSVVKNATIFGIDTLQTDSSVFDIDYYKVKLEAGKIFTITPFYMDTCCWKVFLKLELYDSSKTLIYHDSLGYHGVQYNVNNSGTYYIRISNCQQESGAQKYGLSIRQRNVGVITIISPDGGETFSVLQKMSIRWKADTSYHGFWIMQSCNNGKTWRVIGRVKSPIDTFSWVVPPLKSSTSGTYVKVVAEDIENAPFDVSNGNFTILSSPPDAYAPNNDFSSAYTIAIGDSGVKNAWIGEMDPSDTVTVISNVIDYDTFNLSGISTDYDYFKINLTAKTITRISLFGVNLGYWDLPHENLGVRVLLFDALRNRVMPSLDIYGDLCFTIVQSGTYYIIVSHYFGEWMNYDLSVSQFDAGITLFSPDGAENFSAGQKVKVSWTADPLIKEVNLYYSGDNGATWKPIIGPLYSREYSWDIPPLKQRTDKALVRIRSSKDSTIFAVSKNTFTIDAVTPDAYEQNNDFATAYPIAIGDSVLKNATVNRYADIGNFLSNDPDSCDKDYYKISLSAGKLTTINLFSMLSPELAFAGPSSPYLNLYNDANERVGYANFYMQGKHVLSKSGIYYCEIIPGNIKRLIKYGLSISSLTILSRQESLVDSLAYHKNNQWPGDSSQGAYIAHIVADTTQLTFDLSSDGISTYFFRTFVLSPGEFSSALNTESIIKVISTTNNLYVKTAEITIPYTQSELNGNPENMLTAFWYNDTANQWIPVSNNVDAVKHQITIHDTRLGTYGVFVKSNTINSLSLNMTAPVNGIKMNYQPHEQSLSVHFSLAKAADADLRLYDIQGKCVKSSHIKVGVGNSAFMWYLGALANGKYFLNIKTGTYNVKQPIVILN